LMARAVAPHLMLCRALCSCATSRRSSLDTILAGSAREAESFCSGFARASRTPLGREADVAAVREAIRQYTHDTGFIAEIRWVSKTRVIADVVQNPYFNLGITNYCCRLKRSGNRWVVTSFEKISIAPADEANGPIAI